MSLPSLRRAMMARAWSLGGWLVLGPASLWPVGLGAGAPDTPVVSWTRVNPAQGSGTFEVHADGRWRSTTRAVSHEGAPVTGRVRPEALEGLRQALIKQRFCEIRSTHRSGAGVLENFEELAVALPGLQCKVSIGTASKRPARVDACIKAFRALGTAAHGGGDYSGPSLPGIEDALVPEPRGAVTERRITRTIERKTVEQTLADSQQLTRDARVMPVGGPGKPGLRLSSIRQGGLFWRVGFEDGDVVHTVNGLSLATAERALDAYARLKTAVHLTFALQRTGNPMTLEVDLIP